MKVLFAASECVPFIKTGGLADVAGALPPKLKEQGIDVRVVMPLYSLMALSWREQLRDEVQFEVQLGWRKQHCGVKSLVHDGVTYYFLDNAFYFSRPFVYGLGGDEYERYGFFARAILDFMPLIGFQPDVLHCNDWQTGMVPALLHIQYGTVPFYQGIKTIMTVHNLQYQGVFGIKAVQDVLGLGDELFTSDKLECYGSANYLKAGLVYSDFINTVSPSYAQEIQTAYYGERLEGLLRARAGQLTGILNGIDVKAYDPQNDPLIYAPYDLNHPEDKAVNKASLQRDLGLTVDPKAPLVGLVTRLSHQKGLDLIDYVIRDILDEGVQLVVLGMGDQKYIDLFSWAQGAFPGQVAARFAMDHQLAHRIYAGADMFLMPSLFEPCGLSQMMSLRYGTVPVVRETGGLRDTVLSYNEYTGEGNGFTFFHYNAHDMLHTIRRAVRYFRQEPEIWAQLIRRGMAGDYSWDRSAGDYVHLYQTLMSQVSAPVEAASAEPKRKAPAKKAPEATAPKPRAPRKKAAVEQKG